MRNMRQEKKKYIPLYYLGSGCQHAFFTGMIICTEIIPKDNTRNIVIANKISYHKRIWILTSKINFSLFLLKKLLVFI